MPFIFIRSSTNCEDLPDFVGAGLHDSYVFPDDAIIERALPEQGEDVVLTTEQTSRIVDDVLRIEDLRGCGQDVEGRHCRRQ